MPFYRFIDSDVGSESDSEVRPQQTPRQSAYRTAPAQKVQEPVIIDLASDESDAGAGGNEGDIVHAVNEEGGAEHEEEHKGQRDGFANGSSGHRHLVDQQGSETQTQQRTCDLVDSGIFIPEWGQDQEQEQRISNEDIRNGQGASSAIGEKATDESDEGQDANHPHDTDLLGSFMTNVMRKHRIEPVEDRISKRHQSPNLPDHRASKGPHSLKVTSKDIDDILARPKKVVESMAQSAPQTNRNIPNGDLVKSDVSTGTSPVERASHFTNGPHQPRATPSTTRTPSISQSPQTPLPYDCSQCRLYNRPCNGMIPCFSCVSHGQGKVCVYRGGRGGGSMGAKALHKASRQTSRSSVLQPTFALSRSEKSLGTTTSGVASAKPELRELRPARPPSPVAVSNALMNPQGSRFPVHKPISSSPRGTAMLTKPISKVQMVKRHPTTDKRGVLCETCVKHHQACNGMLPCQRCKVRGKGDLCHYDAKRYMRATVPNEAQPVEPNSGRIITERADARLSPSPPAPISIPSVPRHSAPVRQREIPESDSEDQGSGDIPFRDEEDIDDDFTDTTLTTKHAAAPRYGEEHQPTTNTTTRKRRHSEISDNDDDASPPLDVRQFNRRGPRTKRSFDDEPWQANGWVYAGPKPTNRPMTRLSTSTVERRSYANAPTRETGDTHSKHFRTIKPEHVPEAVKKALANIREDIVLDIAPIEHSMSPPRTKGAGGTNNLETILTEREQADAAALRRALETLRSDPLYMSDGTTEQERANIVTRRRKVLMDQREKDGLSAGHYTSQLLDLATSCVGPDAILGYLMQSRRNKLKVIGLLDGLVKLDVVDGELKVPARGAHGEEWPIVRSCLNRWLNVDVR
ncbi:hypothetical protein LTR10_013592 [Elasticomyces elasticus]|uniref:Zn(2)-C6 fungal-type domain-containing protein n=1 Tax=Exophiala sideris TaxID=1016849 RepID=A0ABR0JQ66_9EURO|nr:hypothetical protein LTR10_013592 [Elasticomyces elasticus]KAK5039731.1 hypothetical protein LTS07_000226 [Exophiala sideris]KAK5041283.1 hypothetical protein LTR13_002758 [Exophiala sideris]KAK5068109.1 hypothetical protein LTR69_000227 [Exophiala sideris]KAK5187410.1 hypothetical protein LTR44_000226 [Eurotiomycetes sp. CCFEE 6388]